MDTNTTGQYQCKSYAWILFLIPLSSGPQAWQDEGEKILQTSAVRAKTLKTFLRFTKGSKTCSSISLAGGIESIIFPSLVI